MASTSSAPPRTKSDILRFQGHHHLRQRLILSVLSGKSIRIDAIRSDDVHVGLRDYEVNLLRLVEKITNGSTIEISVTGASCRLSSELILMLRYLLPLPPWSTTGRLVYPLMSPWSINRLLSGGLDTPCSILQEAIRHKFAGDHRRRRSGHDRELPSMLRTTNLTSGRHDPNGDITSFTSLWYNGRARAPGMSEIYEATDRHLF
jgi:hypothetical protein